MTLISLIVFLIVIGLLLYLIDQLLPELPTKNIIRIVIVVAAILYLLNVFLGGGRFDIPLR